MVYAVMLLILSVAIILLSSKLHIVLYALLSLGFWASRLLRAGSRVFRVITGSFVAVALVISLTDNPVRKRYEDITISRVKAFHTREYSPSDYLDGLTVRILLTTFGFEILKEQNAYAVGVSPANSQALLNQKISEHNLYTGGR